MQFTVPMSIDETAHMLLSHGQAIPIFADTVVEVTSSQRWDSRGEFSVKRRWKGRRGWFSYTAVELKGTIAVVSDYQTQVDAQIHLPVAAYLIGAFAFISLLVGSTGGDAQIGLLFALVIALLFAFDAFVLYRVIRSLRIGKRP